MNLNNYIKTVLSGVKTWALSTFANKRDFDELNSRMYYSEQVEKFFFKNQQISPMDSYGDYVNISFLERQCDEIRVGDALNVVWDGTKYECKVFQFGGSLAIGNKSIIGTLVGESFADTGEPFVIAIWDGYRVEVYYTDMVSESHVISISGMVEKVHKIDEKYLPEMGKSDLIVELEYMGNGHYTADKDIEDILAAEEEGRNVILVTRPDGIKNQYVRIGSGYGNIYVCVGFDGYYTTNDGFRYDYETSEWVHVIEPLMRQSDWSVSNAADPAFINNKPHITERDIMLKDGVNGYNYLIKMENGNLVSQCAIEYIECVEYPTNTRFVEGEVINFPDMVIMATCYDGSKRPVEYTCDPAIATKNMPYIRVSHTEGGIVHDGPVIMIDIVSIEDALIDFDYDDNGDGTYTITGWKETLNGEPSTEMIVPNSNKIII